MNKITSSVQAAAEKVSQGAATTATKVSKTIQRGANTASSVVSKTLPKQSSVKEDNTVDPDNGVLLGLMEHRISAVVQDLDHYRKNTFMAVETDYIIHVTCRAATGGQDELEFAFIISKTFSAFRTLADQLYDEAETYMVAAGNNVPKHIAKLAKYCDAVKRLMDSQVVEYLTKVNYKHVQALAKQRSQVIDQFLEETMSTFPDESAVDAYPFARRVAVLIEKFFLTDHCKAGEGEDDRFGALVKNPIKKNYQVVPHTVKERKIKSIRESEEQNLADASALQVDEEADKDTGKSNDFSSIASSFGASFVMLIDEKPLLAAAAFAGVMQVSRAFGRAPVTLDLDVLLVLGFVCFCLGVHSPRFMGVDKKAQPGRPQSKQSTEAKIMRRSMVSLTGLGELAALEDEAVVIHESPMQMFPEGAKLGSVKHAWSIPPCAAFMVRGENYLSDKKKIKSDPFLFQSRGVDLFLTDQCPVNVGRLSSLLNDELRNLPTFIINLRLPWGVFIMYYEIPGRFLPFIKGCYGDESVTKADLEAKMNEMNNSDRCCARFLLGDDAHKRSTFKIIPQVVEGPWVVKASVGGKPAIIGNKLPVDFVYQPEDKAADGSKQELYLEADLDIVSSAAARRILSLVRSYTQELTIDLGFAIQGNTTDELPEQMMTGSRIHGIDPLHAPPLPTMKDLFFGVTNDDNDVIGSE